MSSQKPPFLFSLFVGKLQFDTFIASDRFNIQSYHSQLFTSRANAETNETKPDKLLESSSAHNVRDAFNKQQRAIG